MPHGPLVWIVMEDYKANLNFYVDFLDCLEREKPPTYNRFNTVCDINLSSCDEVYLNGIRKPRRQVS